MSDLMALALKLAFLAFLWLFIIFAANVIRTDLFGRKVSTADLAATPAAGLAKPPRQRRSSRKSPRVLKIVHGRQEGLVMELGDGLMIGRSADCRLILDDDYVSTRHARIVRTEEGYLVEDLGSTNGTYLNNERISAPLPFTFADELRIGRTLMILEK
ncbi:MAG: FHA domain-containing protein [Propionibacteriaceae bacterium]|nr:FHA domain-containing protein [Micropruina sp.]MBK9159184.1 FHA domain-containing protein [Micropruina sp.]